MRPIYLLSVIAIVACKKEAPSPTAAATTPSATPTIAVEVKPVAAPPVPTFKPAEFVGGWARIETPLAQDLNTKEAILAYQEAIIKRWPGEPPVNVAKAKAKAERLRDKFSAWTHIAPEDITVSVREGGILFSIKAGVRARANLPPPNDTYEYDGCSEYGVGNDILTTEEFTMDALNKVGIRAFACGSSNCGVAMDLRPPAEHRGGVQIGGKGCFSYADAGRLMNGR